jgi:hypothetical protein
MRKLSIFSHGPARIRGPTPFSLQICRDQRVGLSDVYESTERDAYGLVTSMAKEK